MSATCRFQVFHPTTPVSTCEQRLTIASDDGTTIPASELAAALAIHPPSELAARAYVYRLSKRLSHDYCYLFDRKRPHSVGKTAGFTLSEGERGLAARLDLDLENYSGGPVALVLYLQLPLEVRDPLEYTAGRLRESQERAARFLSLTNWNHSC